MARRRKSTAPAKAPPATAPAERTLGHALALADKGWKRALQDDVHLRNGLNVAQGRVTYEAVARVLGYDYLPAERLLA